MQTHQQTNPHTAGKRTRTINSDKQLIDMILMKFSQEHQAGQSQRLLQLEKLVSKLLDVANNLSKQLNALQQVVQSQSVQSDTDSKEILNVLKQFKYENDGGMQLGRNEFSLSSKSSDPHTSFFDYQSSSNNS